MNRILKFLLIFGIPLAAIAQTTTPSTTLCAAQTFNQTTLCLTSTTGIANQTGVYVDQEYELVQLSANSTVCTGPCNVPVSRNNRNSGSGAQPHNSGAVAWLELVPTAVQTAGVTGFYFGSNVTDIGPCTRSAQVYLPHIWVNTGNKRDCDAVGTGNGVWVDYAPGNGADYGSPTPPLPVPASGAFSVSSGFYQITKSSAAAAMTLAAPTAGIQDGMVITVYSTTAEAHTITATSLIYNGTTGGPHTTATFAAYPGAFIVLQAYNGYWYVMASNNVTIS